MIWQWIWLVDFNNLGGVWVCCLNNTTCISTILFHPYVFSQHLNNVARTILPNDSLNAFLNYFLWLVIHLDLCKLHVVKFIMSLVLFIQILVYYLLKVPIIALVIASLCKFLIVKFVIVLAFFKKQKFMLKSKKAWIFFIKKKL